MFNNKLKTKDISWLLNGDVKNRKFNNFDLYPTILASLGFEIEGNKLGFGTNLYSGEKTLSEKLGSSYVDKELLKRNSFYD